MSYPCRHPAPDGFAPCTRAADHPGPCAHPFGVHPTCPGCWGFYGPGSQPVRLIDKSEVCHVCGRSTDQGIYRSEAVRV